METQRILELHCFEAVSDSALGEVNRGKERRSCNGTILNQKIPAFYTFPI